MRKCTKEASVFISEFGKTARAPGTPGCGFDQRSVPVQLALAARGLSATRTHLKTPGVPGALAVLFLLVSAASGCVTGRPEQRAVLADPVMRFNGDAREAAQRQHVIENREGSFGGSSVKGGGCGCN